MQLKQWQRQVGNETFVISTAPDLISREFVQASFADPSMYWATPVDSEALEAMLKSCCFFGLYVHHHHQSPPAAGIDTPASPPTAEYPTVTTTFKQIGMARLVTDFVSLAFLTDVFVVPEHQGKGLAKWLMCCVKEFADALPAPRRLMLMAKNAPHATRFYERTLGAHVYDQERSQVVFMSTATHLDS